MRRVLVGILILFFILAAGTVGYMTIEGCNLFDGLYMTVITITTVGYAEVVPLGRAGRIFTIVLLLTGVSFGLYVVGQVTEAMVEGGLRAIFGRTKMEKRVAELKEHYIVCGFGRIGKVICQILHEHKRPFVVIENRADELKTLEEMGYFFLDGDASDDKALLKAGIQRAKGLVAVVSSDAENVYITLSARGLNRDLFIVARSGGGKGAETKLLRAGANKVISPYDIGARRMAHLIVRPTVTDFIDLTLDTGDAEGISLRLEEVEVSARSKLVNLPLLESNIRKTYDLIVVAIKRRSGEMLFNPNPQSMIQEGDILIVLGDQTNIAAFEKTLL